MNTNIKTTCLYGIIKPNSEKEVRFDDSKLFPKEMQYGILLKRLKIYFGNNTKKIKTLLGFQSTYINYITGKKLDVDYKGGERNEETIEVKGLAVEQNDYIKFFEFDFNDEYINYIKIISDKGKEIELGIRPEKPKIILNYEGDNMIQFFWGYYSKEEGITSIGFRYTPRKQFNFAKILPILKLRYKLNHDNKFKIKYEDNYKELLKNNITMIYLYKACLLPDTCFSRIIKLIINLFE